jgi:4-amino-4-deoxy-L-arabinose transferase-like glycosyltransferase
MNPEAPAASRHATRILLVALFAGALLIRVGTALWLEHRTRQQGKEHDFPDSELYWMLGLRIADGQAYDDGKRQVLRSPGYPVFLAACIRLFGPSLTAARHTQAAVGALSCVLLFVLVRKLIDTRTAWLAACLAAMYPFAVFLSAVLLSEAVFTALLLVQLILLSELLETLLRGDRIGWALLWSMLAGLCGSAATLVRPSWFLATLLAAVLVALLRVRKSNYCPKYSVLITQYSVSDAKPLPQQPPSPQVGGVWVAASALILGFVLGMLPWWVRNWQVTGHFVSTTLWVGASLVDGLNEQANGESNMKFMEEPARFGLDPNLNQMDEWEQDRYLREKAWEFACSHPGRVLELAALKFARFWNPLPNAAPWRASLLGLLSLFTCAPLMILAIGGAWRMRQCWVTILLLAGPVIYFCAIHLVFVSSVRYREAAILPVLGLVAVAIRDVVGRVFPSLQKSS